MKKIFTILLTAVCCFAFPFTASAIEKKDEVYSVQEIGTIAELAENETRPYLINNETGEVYYYDDDVWTVTTVQPRSTESDMVVVSEATFAVPKTSRLSTSDEDLDVTYSVRVKMSLTYSKSPASRGTEYKLSAASATYTVEDKQVVMGSGRYVIGATGAGVSDQIRNGVIAANKTSTSVTTYFTKGLLDSDPAATMGARYSRTLTRGTSSEWVFESSIYILNNGATFWPF